MSRAKRTKTGARGSVHAPPTNAFPSGVSGNPSGRPKLTEAQREAREARAAAQPDAVARLVAIIKSDKSKDQDAIAAAKVILDGLEPLKLEMTGKDGEPLKTEVRLESAAPDPQKFARIAAILQRAGVLPSAVPDKAE